MIETIKSHINKSIWLRVKLTMFIKKKLDFYNQKYLIIVDRGTRSHAFHKIACVRVKDMYSFSFSDNSNNYLTNSFL